MLKNTHLRYFIVFIVLLFQWDSRPAQTQQGFPISGVTATTTTQRTTRPAKFTRPSVMTQTDTTESLNVRSGDTTTTQRRAQLQPKPISNRCSYSSVLLQFSCYLLSECGNFENTCLDSADVSGQISDRCCLQCGCTLETCSKTKTCCPMIAENLPINNTKNPNVECQKTYLYASMDTKIYTQFFHEYMLVSFCPKTSISSRVTQELCKHPDTEEPHVELADIIPVTDPVTLVSYRNKHCAKCNAIYSTVSWIAEFRSQDYPLMEESLSGMMHETRLRNDSFVTFVPPHSLHVTSAVCFTDLIEDCQLPKTAGMEHDYLLPYTHGHLRYKNILVAACNGINVTGSIDGSCANNNVNWYNITVDLNPTPPNGENTTEITKDQLCHPGEMIDPLTEKCCAVYCYYPLHLDVISRSCIEPIEPITGPTTFYIPLRVLSNVPLTIRQHYLALYYLMTLYSNRIKKTMEVCQLNWFMTLNINFTEFKTLIQLITGPDADIINLAMTIIINIYPSDLGEITATPAKILNDLHIQLSFTWSKLSEREGRTLDNTAEIEGFKDGNGEADELVLRTVIDYKYDSWLRVPPITACTIDQRVVDVVNSVRIGHEVIDAQWINYLSKDVYGQKLIVGTELFNIHLCVYPNRASDLDFMKCPSVLYDVKQMSFTRSHDGIRYIDNKGYKTTLGFDQFKTYNMTHVRVCVDAVIPTNDAFTPANEVSTPSNDASTTTNDVSTLNYNVSRPTNDVYRPTNDPTSQARSPTVDDSTLTNDASRPTNDVSRPANDVSRTTNDVSRPTNDVSRPTNDASRPTNDVSKPTNDVSRRTNDVSRSTNDESRPTNDEFRPTNDVSRLTNDVSRPTNDVFRPTTDESRPTNDESRPTNDVSRPTTDESRPTNDVSRPTHDLFRPTSNEIGPADEASRPSSMADINNIDIVAIVIIALRFCLNYTV